MIFEPLNKENIEEAIVFVNSIFPGDAEHLDNPAKAYRASLDAETYKEYKDKYTLKSLEYFVVREDVSKKIIGVTGFYTRTLDPKNVAWFGWYGIDPSQRGKGIGRKILEWTIKLIKDRGFNTFRLYTSTDPNEAAAQILYEKLGFKIIGETEHSVEDPESDYKTLYRELKLTPVRSDASNGVN